MKLADDNEPEPADESPFEIMAVGGPLNARRIPVPPGLKILEVATPTGTTSYRIREFGVNGRHVHPLLVWREWSLCQAISAIMAVYSHKCSTTPHYDITRMLTALGDLSSEEIRGEGGIPSEGVVKAIARGGPEAAEMIPWMIRFTRTFNGMTVEQRRRLSEFMQIMADAAIKLEAKAGESGCGPGPSPA